MNTIYLKKKTRRKGIDLPMYAVILKRITLSFTLLALMLVFSGCETESSEQIALSITPNTVTLRAGQSQEFVASGFEDYTWSLSDADIGVLSTRKGNSTIYTALRSATNHTQTLTVTVNVPESGTGSVMSPGTTNRVSARALITHRP